MESYNRLTLWEIESISSTAVDLFHLINEFVKLRKLMEEVTVYLIDDQMQEAERDTFSVIL